MAFDGFFCAALARELNEAVSLINARVEKINCRGSSAEFSLYGDKTKKHLFISLQPSAAFITVNASPVLPNDIPNPFCLLLRKHLQAGKIKAVEAVANERIIRFTLDCPDELGHISEKTLYAEIMGKCSNLVLTANGKILGALHTADLVSYKRAVMTGIAYELPPAQDKISARDTDKDEFIRLCSLCPDKAADRFLIDTFFCFSPLTAWETVYSACGNGDATVSEAGAERLYSAVSSLCAYVDAGVFSPCAAASVEGSLLDFSFAEMHASRFGNGRSIVGYPTLCALISAFFGERSSKSLLSERVSDLRKTVTARIKRIEKKEAAQHLELAECAEKDKLRIFGELITANIYRIKQGDSSCVCDNWYDGTSVTVPLDVRLSPSANAEKFFKKYRKAKNAEAAVTAQLAESANEKRYLESVLDSVERCESAEEAELIRDELSSTGYIRKNPRSGHFQRKPCRPFAYKSPNGLAVFAGRNNVMNDTLTRSADKTDLWFHVKGFAGSHVIMFTEGTEPDAADYTFAARVAAYHSSVRGSLNVQVDYTPVRYVRKPAGAKPGFVIYDKYNTAVVDATPVDNG